MPSAVSSQQWQEKATGFFSSSGAKLKEASQTAGTFVGEVAKDAKGNVSDVAERFGSMVKNRWTILRQPATRHAVQESLICAAATTGTLLRKGITGTKDKVVVGKTKVEEVAKKTAQKSKIILTDLERWQKGVASTDGKFFYLGLCILQMVTSFGIFVVSLLSLWTFTVVHCASPSFFLSSVFGVPIEVTVQRQQASKPIPLILVKCADYLVLSGLNSQYLFKDEGDKKVIEQLVTAYNQDFNASIPEAVNPIDVAALIKYYIASLPEPLTTFELYDEIKGARSSIHAMRNVLKKLPSVNYMTLEFITALLLRVSQKSVLNKMDARSLAMEMSAVIMWQKDRKPDSYRKYWSHLRRSPSTGSMDPAPAYSEWDMLADDGEDMDASSHIPLDDATPVDFGAIEVIQCLIEQHNPIFTDANETVWR
ncbi:hypothetical protein F3Y22_tig00110469pilonHSYRG00165 [Hibiscus syriacus]|uniref:Rho-GAP domain-containing protein n=1 Tax=Hibiscus syriacus TaxID=106335 RepID=A0A6A3AI44_HIBSY|nr:hypothetical protein F3Y22_tig00110469pilonHSYRG00165 [Hibiscus syriacus]